MANNKKITLNVDRSKCAEIRELLFSQFNQLGGATILSMMQTTDKDSPQLTLRLSGTTSPAQEDILKKIQPHFA